MLTPKAIARFIALVLLIFGLLVLPWSILRPAYTSLFCASGQLLFGSFNAYAKTEFHPSEHPTSSADTTITMETVNPRKKKATRLSVRLTGYLPFAQVVAMILATPVPWRRRMIALALGTLLIHAFVLFRLWTILYFAFATMAPMHVPYGQFTMDLLGIVASPTPAFLVPPLIWLMVIVRSDMLDAPGRRTTPANA